MQYSSIPFDNHVTQGFSDLQQGSDELLKMYYTMWTSSFQNPLHFRNSQILAEGLNHYTAMYGLNSRKLKDSAVGHWSTQWRSMEDCFRNICAFAVGYKTAKDYGRAEFHAQKVSTINEVKSKKDPGPCFRCGGPHFQNSDTK